MRALAILLATFTATCAVAQPAVPPGTYRAEGAGEVLHVRIAADGGVELFNPRDSRTSSARPLFSTARGITGFTSGGENFSIGPGGGGLQMSLGMRLFTLSAMPAAEFGAPQAAAAPPAATAKALVLGGMSLFSASGMSGYRELRTLDLCSDGSFLSRVEELQSSQHGRASGVRNDNGTWTLSGSTLHLRYARAGAAQHAFERIADDVVSLDGRRYGMERSSRCR